MKEPSSSSDLPPLPLLHGVAESPRVTRILANALRPPATRVAMRYPITTGFWSGAPVDQIADSLARGERWRIGPATTASPRSPQVIWLLEIDVPYEKQIAAWRVLVPSSLSRF